MLRWLTLSFLALFLLSGCTVALFEVKYVPPPKTPRASLPPEETTVPSLTEISRKERINGTKSWQINADISDFSARIGLGPDNCIQVVLLSNGDDVIDFGDVACPTENGLLPAENIVFTLFEQDAAGTTFPPEYDLVLADVPLGHGKVTSTSPIVVSITDLCTNDYAGVCEIIVANDKFKEFLAK